MDTDSSKTFAPGVHVTEYLYADEYCGTAQALTAAGIVRADQLPGQPGMPKKMGTFYDGQLMKRGQRAGQRGVRWLHIETTGKTFKVLRGVTEEVETDRRSEWTAEIAARREAERQAESQRFVKKMKADLVLYRMVNSADEYRKKMIKKMEEHVRYLCTEDVLPNTNHGFSMGESVAAEFGDLLERMIDLISTADVQFDARRHKEINHQCKVDVAKGDDGFQRTLKSMARANLVV